LGGGETLIAGHLVMLAFAIRFLDVAVVTVIFTVLT
jgi:energy-converting hydrogenase Eha subunit C